MPRRWISLLLHDHVNDPEDHQFLIGSISVHSLKEKGREKRQHRHVQPMKRAKNKNTRIRARSVRQPVNTQYVVRRYNRMQQNEPVTNLRYRKEKKS